MQKNNLTATTQIFVGTTNPAKLKAVEQVLRELAGVEIPVQGFSVPSGVSEQPRTDFETQKGSANRAKAVLKLARSKKLLKKSHTNLCIGLEGGVFTRGKELWCTVWVTLIDAMQSKNLIQVNGLRFKLPPEIASPILTGTEMGTAVGAMARNPNLKREGGMIGLVTNLTVNRTSEYANFVRLAVGLWLGQGWQQELES